MTTYRTKTKWNVSTYNGSSWNADGTIPAPVNVEIEESFKSTAELVELADGSQAKIVPEHKYTPQSITLNFSRFDTNEDTRIKLYNYAKNNTGLKLVTHFNYWYFGYFDEISTKWVLEGKTGSNQRFTQNVKFQLFPVDGKGVVISGTTGAGFAI